jgi:hypothetical protein
MNFHSWVNSCELMLENACIISLIVLFIHATTWDGNIFAGIKSIIKPEGNLYKIVYGCPTCMTPYWGTVVYLLFFNDGYAKDWFLTVFAAAGIAVIWVLMIDIKDSLKPPQGL